MSTGRYWLPVTLYVPFSCVVVPLAPQNLPGGVSPHEVKDFFGQIDGDGAELLLHGTRPPRGSLMISFTDFIVADHSRSAQGRVHFINAIGDYAGAARVNHMEATLALSEARQVLVAIQSL